MAVFYTMRKIITAFCLALLLISCKSKPQLIEELEAEPESVFEIKKPVFEIISIVILQADIVVTEFEAVLKITNHNDFALDLTSITYLLFGNNALWASDTNSDILHIPPLTSNETMLTFQMNFIDMRRSLLDDVIAMRNVRYIFSGEAVIQPDIPNSEPFRMNYESTGFSEVRRN
ncbi:MAG: LEA type 2 family protein [Treponema sp.]|jgi:LEA14-like dessication related protein|nr:LEA type 2 family protein [Treponema sp.]